MSAPLSRTVAIVNRRGLHARASAKVAALARTFDATITVSKDDYSVDAQSIMGLMMLAAGIGSEVCLTAEGAEAPAALAALAALIADRFGEEE
jgi:phosphocarrier protein HPr